jgi:glycerol dehydrogenase-like iron-containing ADH family enzyme
MKKTIVLVTLFLSCAIAQANDIQLFNPDVLGQSTSKELKVLRDKTAHEIEPISVIVNIKNGFYNAATVIYPEELRYETAMTALKDQYKKYGLPKQYKEMGMTVWRIEDKRYAVSLIKEKKYIKILYIQFKSTEDILKEIRKVDDLNE